MRRAASNSNAEILQKFHSKAPYFIVNAPRLVSNNDDLALPAIKNLLSNHLNPYAICLLNESNELRCLKRDYLPDLPFYANFIFFFNLF